MIKNTVLPFNMISVETVRSVSVIPLIEKRYKYSRVSNKKDRQLCTVCKIIIAFFKDSSYKCITIRHVKDQCTEVGTIVHSLTNFCMTQSPLEL